MAPPLISVIVPVCNGDETLKVQLDALADQVYDGEFEVLICDNMSTDGTAALAKAFGDTHPNFRLIDANEGRGAAFARNAGAAVARGDIFIFVDHDDQVAPGYLAGIEQALRTHDLVGARIDHVTLDPANPSPVAETWQSDGLVGSPWLSASSGCALAARRSCYELVGGFDPRFKYCEDIAFCWSAQLAGGTLGFAPDAVLRYRHRTGWRLHLRQQYNWGVEGPYLAQVFREFGCPRVEWTFIARQWRDIARSLLRARTRGDLTAVGGVFLSESGRIQGQLQNGWRRVGSGSKMRLGLQGST